MYPEPIQKLAALFSRLPGIGPRMAARLAFHLLKVPDQEVQEFGEAILQTSLPSTPLRAGRASPYVPFALIRGE